MNQFRLVKTVDRFSQRVIVAVTTAVDGRLDTRLGQTFAVPNADVLGSPYRSGVSKSYRRPVGARTAPVQAHPERSPCSSRTDAPTDDATGKHVDHERHVQPTLPRRDIGEVGPPKLIRPLSLELPIDPVHRRGALVSGFVVRTRLPRTAPRKPCMSSRSNLAPLHLTLTLNEAGCRSSSFFVVPARAARRDRLPPGGFLPVRTGTSPRPGRNDQGSCRATGHSQ